MAKVAWIGLGAMGSRMAMRLVDAGHEVTIWNRSPHRTESLTRRDTVHAAATAAEAAAKAEVVAVMVSNPAAINEVVHGPDGVAAAMAPGSTLVDFSTVGPAAVAALRAGLPPEVAVVDSPVLGSIAEAEAGTLKLLAGGSAEVLDRCRPVLSPLGELIHVGPLGAGAAAKLVANFALMGSLAVLGETLALADALGIEPQATWDLLETTPLAAQARRRRPAIESNSYPPRFALHLARKDADLITDAADERGVELRMGRALAEWLSDGASAGLGEQDYTAILGHILSAAPGAGESR
jgi:3-hydroxyisobutyrate dehydrogenase-like beta-hydroxyacid dehydrogenase